MPETIRTPVAITPPTDSGYAIVVCDDGAAFYWDSMLAEWATMPPIPGTLAARQQAEPRTVESDLYEGRV